MSMIAIVRDHDRGDHAEERISSRRLGFWTMKCIAVKSVSSGVFSYGFCVASQLLLYYCGSVFMTGELE